VPTEHFLQQCRHHLILKDIWLLLLFSEDGSEKVSRRDLFARFLNISGNQTPTCRRDGDMAQSHTCMRWQERLEMNNRPCTDP